MESNKPNVIHYILYFGSPFSAEFLRHCVLSSEAQRCALPSYQIEEMRVLNVSFPRVEMEPSIVALTAARLTTALRRL